MRIGELAKLSHCEVETIRYYEREGLIPPPPRSEGNYRHYNQTHVDTLGFIRHCRSLGMSLDDVRRLQQFQQQPETACDEIDAMLDRHLQNVEKRIHSLQHLQSQLIHLRGACQSHLTARECGILQNLQSLSDDHHCVCHPQEEERALS